MGAAWCRDRIENAHNSKSPIDRLITRCSNAINSKPIYTKPNQSKPANDIVFKQIRYPAAIVPVHACSHTRGQPPRPPSAEWTDVPLHVPDKTPIPPPRRKKRRKVNSLDVLNSQLDQIYESRNNLPRLHASRPLFFGDPLPRDTTSSSSSPERPSKPFDDERRRKTRAKKIMDSKKHFTKHSPPKLSLARSQEDWTPPKMVKNISSVSLPSYAEIAAPNKSEEDDEEFMDVDWKKKLREKRNVSTASLPGDSVLTAISGVTMTRLETYMKKCKSFGSLKPQQLLEKLEEITNKQENESSDSWSGLDDWDLGIIEYCDADATGPPMVPRCRLSSKKGPLILDPGADQLDVEEELPPTPPVLSASLENVYGESAITNSNLSLQGSEGTGKSLVSIVIDPDASEEHDTFPTTNLFKVLSSYSLASDVGPTPPRRRSRADDLRRQSYHGEGLHRVKIPRSMSLDPSKDEMPCFNKWRNVSFSSSQHSLTTALEEYLEGGRQSSKTSLVSGMDTPPPKPSRFRDRKYHISVSDAEEIAMRRPSCGSFSSLSRQGTPPRLPRKEKCGKPMQPSSSDLSEVETVSLPSMPVNSFSSPSTPKLSLSPNKSLDNLSTVSEPLRQSTPEILPNLTSLTSPSLVLSSSRENLANLFFESSGSKRRSSEDVASVTITCDRDSPPPPPLPTSPPPTMYPSIQK